MGPPAAPYSRRIRLCRPEPGGRQHPGPVFFERRLDFFRDEFPERGRRETAVFKDAHGVLPLDAAEIGFVHEIPQQPLQLFRQRARDVRRDRKILVFGLAQPAEAVADDDAGPRPVVQLAPPACNSDPK